MAFGLGFGLFSLLILVNIASLVLGIAMIVSASKYPDWAFERTGGTKFIWQILPIILIFVCGWANLVMGIIWFTSKRDEVERAAQSGGTPYGYGAPPQYGYGAPPQPGYGAPQPGWGPPPAAQGYPPPWTPPSAPGPKEPPAWPPAQSPPGDPPPPAAPQQ